MEIRINVISYVLISGVFDLKCCTGSVLSCGTPAGLTRDQDPVVTAGTGVCFVVIPQKQDKFSRVSHRRHHCPTART